MNCKYCGGETSGYDRVKRILKDRRGAVLWVEIKRVRCKLCHRVQRELTDELLPYKHYSKDIIEGVIDGLITEWTYGFEDYPCEMTRKRWITQKKQGLLCKNIKEANKWTKSGFM